MKDLYTSGFKLVSVTNVLPHLVIADGHRLVQQVADVPLVLEALRLQLHPLAVRLLCCLVHQLPHLLDLGDSQGLRAITIAIIFLFHNTKEEEMAMSSYQQYLRREALQVLCFFGQRIIVPDRLLFLDGQHRRVLSMACEQIEQQDKTA